MARKLKIKSYLEEAELKDGSIICFEKDILAEGGKGEVHHLEGRQAVVKFFKSPDDQNDPELLSRLESIIQNYNPTLDPDYGKYWENIYRWPASIVIKPKLGVITPVYPKSFYFRDGREKILSWFVLSSKVRKTIPTDERGNWLGHLQLTVLMARTTRRLHSAGLAHSDLSYKNFLGDPVTGKLLMIDLDELVVPGIHPPKVEGTPGLIAPEVLMGTAEPSIRTDLHALAVLIYQMLLFRHPLKGTKSYSDNPIEDERIGYGEKALFIEHPTDQSNRPAGIIYNYSILGPDLAKLIEEAFIEHIHTPEQRPTALDWETALVKTTDLIYPCSNPSCENKWFVLQNNSLECPWCRTKIVYPNVPILIFYKEQLGKPGNYLSEGRSLVVWHGLRLHKWHVFDNNWPGENADRVEHGYFIFHNGEWHLVNQEMSMGVIENGLFRPIRKGESIVLRHNQQIRLSDQSHGRLVLVQLRTT